MIFLPVLNISGHSSFRDRHFCTTLVHSNTYKRKGFFSPLVYTAPLYPLNFILSRAFNLGQHVNITENHVCFMLAEVTLKAKEQTSQFQSQQWISLFFLHTT